MFLIGSSFVRRALAPVALVSLFGFVATPLAVAQSVGNDLARDTLARPTSSTLSYGTYLGGSGLFEDVTSVATDASGNVFVTGLTDGRVRVSEGAFQTEPPGGGDAFIAKLDPAGSPVWATYLGGSHGDVANDVAVGPDGTVYVAGTTLSEDFPTTEGALQRELRGQNTGCDPHCYGDAFVTRLSPDGSALEYSTYLGGSASDGATGIAITAMGAAMIAGETSSADFAASRGSFDPTYNVPTCFDMCEADVFLAELNPAGTSLIRATYFGGTSWDSSADVALDAAGNVYVAGSSRSTDLPTTLGAFQPGKNGNGGFDFNGFIAAFEGDLASARYVTYLGRRSEEQISGLTVEAGGRAWVTGFGGRGIPTTADAVQRDLRGASDAFVTGLTSDGSALVYSTRLGGSREDYGRGIALDDRGRVHVGGSTASTDLPVRRAFQPANAGLDDLFYARFKPGAPRVQRTTYIGGARYETATDLTLAPGGSAYLVGATESTDLPLAGRFIRRDPRGNDGVLMRVDGGRLVHAKVGDSGFWQPRMRPHLGATVKWHFAHDNERANRIVETAVDLFDSKARPPGAEYYFTLPAGRFSIAHARGDAVQRIAVAPAATYADDAGGVEVRWARFPLGRDIAFDVQVKVGRDQWQTWLTNTTDVGATYLGAIADYRFRVRVQNTAAGMTTPWSPPVLLSEPS